MREWYPVIVTFAFTTLSVVFRLLSRRDGDLSPKRNDLYIAQSLSMGSVSALAVYLFKSVLSNHPASLYCAGLLFGFIVMTGILACVDRWMAWEDHGGVFRRKVAAGIIIPDLMGIAGYFVVFFFAKTWGL